MRQIKFRAWHKNKPYGHNQMEYGIQDASDINSTRTSYPGFGYYLGDEKEGNCIVMQFTGLKDSKEKEIYEGDILKREFDNEVVEFQCDLLNAGFAGRSLDKKRSKFLKMLVNTQETEVIGNIYETPALLKKRKKEHGTTY